MDFDKETEKLYYTIGEVADMFAVNSSLIRFWEKEFEVLKPKKNKKGNRLFTAEDLSNLKLIFHLVKERGYTLEGAKKKLNENKENIEEQVQIKETLVRMRQFLSELKDSI
ncbi:MAG TPA: MerR family transcriptional regulator [Bacteroidia bacterium]|nr:MerR family transcriptional regulator [Bacteroidia bacterium]